MSTAKVTTFLVFLSIVSIVLSTKDCNSGQCFPSPKEIASKFAVNASSTCGIDAPEIYCQPKQQVCTATCDTNGNTTRHPPTFVNDAYNLQTFWKSENVERPVYLQLDFGSTFMLYRSVVTFQFEVPAAMYFAKSTDYGATFTPLSYLATDCNKFFKMATTTTNRRNGLAVECFLIDPENTPSKQLEYGPMRDSAAAEGVLDNRQNQSFFLMTNIRLMLVSYITPERFNPATATLALNRSLSFTVQDWDVLAACYCNGQAAKCENDTHCVCERNTAGRNCETCLPLFNNRPYQSWEACEDCGCNNHAKSCQYNTVKKYGVCDNCTDNTTGDKCELCKVEHYRNSAVMVNHTNTCLPCGCNLNGVPNVSNRTHCHPTSGQCQCKSRVQGRACDTCKPTFWNLKAANLLGCEECNCSFIGTVNASQLCDAANKGQCPCKENVGGRTCDRCKDGYYNFTIANPKGCIACNCNPAGSLNVTCNSTGGCYCRPRFYGLKCEQLQSGYFAAGVDSLTTQAEHGSLSPAQEMKIHHSMVLLSNGKSDLFVGVVLTESNDVANPTRLTMTITVPKTAAYTLALRYMTSYNWQFLKLTVQLRTLFTPFSCNGGPSVTRNDPHVFLGNATAASEDVSFGSNVCLLEGTYTAVLELQSGSAGGNKSASLTVDSLVVIPTVSSYSLYRFGSVAVQQNTTFYYNAASSFKRWSVESAYGCKALSGYYGHLYGQGQACSCNATGANNPNVCDQCGGQCACKPNVIGRTCDRCRPDYYNHTSGYGCEACSCHPRGSIRSSCHAMTGKCDCHANVINRQCSSCQENYYNLNSGSGCLACNCTAEYSTSLQCHADTGVCSCKRGVNGAKCTTCQDQFYNLTSSGCSDCSCSSPGSYNNTCDKANGQCNCKAKVIGRTCDNCPVGYYGLGSPHPNGCLECHCSNKINMCNTAVGYVEAEVTTSLAVTSNFNKLDGWQVVNNNGLTVAAAWDWNAQQNGLELEKGYIRTTVNGEQYFKAPEKYLKEGRFSYTYSLFFKLQQDNSDTPYNSTKGDVILKGKALSQPLVYRFPSRPGNIFKEYQVKFIESDWHVGTTDGRLPTSNELLAVLSTLDYLYIRAKWSTVNGQKTRLADIKMKYSNKASSGKTAFNVEKCNCSKEYAGDFCERCAPGYTRATPNGGMYDKCVPCACNNHSTTCDPESGVCSDCQHNTTGTHCEKCSNGLYGNATHGTANDCKACPCPGGPFSTNQFSPTCYLGSDGQPTCDKCSEGYEGRRCDTCKTGYYGTPKDANGKCQKCNCNGNVDTSVAGNCNTTTGECSNCGFNTSGVNCEQCAPHFYGNALNRTCSRCLCNSTGTRPGQPCNHVTGKCVCQPRVIGWSCDRCEANTFNYSSGVGCSVCNCHANGANKTQCNEVTGECDCKSNVNGLKCDTCTVGFWGVHLNPPCQECNCTRNYTMNNTVCDVRNGLCQCKVSLGGAKYGGRQCERCEDRSVGEPQYCTPCKEPCFNKWFDMITVESDKVKLLETNVTDMLKAFGGSSVTVDSINATIQELNKNLSYADGVFNGAKYNTKDKQDQINRIKTSINDLHRRLNESSRIIKDAEDFLKATVDGFNGTVRVLKADKSGPHVDVSGNYVYADWVSLTSMATSYRSRAQTLNESANASYKNISMTYEAIKLANETSALIARQVSDAMTKLNQVSSQRQDVEKRLGPDFQAQLQNNSALLDEIKKISDEIKALLLSATTTGSNAKSTVIEAEGIMNTANKTVHLRKQEAEKTLADSEDAFSRANKSRSEALNAQAVAAQFKANASAVLKDAQTTLQNVTDAINTMATSINKSREAQAIADRVAGMSMPVSMDTIKGLTNEIKSIPVDEALINKTYDGAADGLQKANEVEASSKKAIDLAQKTRDEVQSIEKAIRDAKTIKNETTKLHQETDMKVNQINNITNSIQARFGNASLIGKETLQLINKTISNVDKGLQCFNDSKKTAEEAVVRAHTAYEVTQQAVKLNASVNANITKLSPKIDKLAAIAKANYTEIVKAYNDSVQLHKDVNQAEVLLDEYVKQRQEMEALKKETETLESELDTLIRDFDEESKKYTKCGNA